jgi:hypothetical protein
MGPVCVGCVWKFAVDKGLIEIYISESVFMCPLFAPLSGIKSYFKILRYSDGRHQNSKFPWTLYQDVAFLESTFLLGIMKTGADSRFISCAFQAQLTSRWWSEQNTCLPNWRRPYKPMLNTVTYFHKLCLHVSNLKRILLLCKGARPPLWSCGQCSWLQIRRPRGRFPSTTRFSDQKKKKKRKTSSGSGTGFTQPREYNWGATW